MIKRRSVSRGEDNEDGEELLRLKGRKAKKKRREGILEDKGEGEEDDGCFGSEERRKAGESNDEGDEMKVKKGREKRGGVVEGEDEGGERQGGGKAIREKTDEASEVKRIPKNVQ